MVRVFAGLVIAGLVVALAAVAADDPLTQPEREKLGAQWEELLKVGTKQYLAGQFDEAGDSFGKALDIARRLFPPAEFPDGHLTLASSLNNMGLVHLARGKDDAAVQMISEALAIYRRQFPKSKFPDGHSFLALNIGNLGAVLLRQAKLAEAEPLLRESLEMQQRLHKGRDHPELALALNNMGNILGGQGKEVEAEDYYRQTLEMRQRLYKGDHTEVASSLLNLAGNYSVAGKKAEAEALYREALEMRQRLFKGDHPQVAAAMMSLSAQVRGAGRYPEAEKLARGALAMRQRIHKGDNPDVILSLTDLSAVLRDQGKYADAEALEREALDMTRRVFPADHPVRGGILATLAATLFAEGKYAEAEPLLREQRAIHRGMLGQFAARRSEGEALVYLAKYQTAGRDLFVSNALALRAEAADVYPEVWVTKAAIARIYEYRQQAARAATADPRAVTLLTGLAETRRTRANLVLAPQPRDEAARAKRVDEIERLDKQIAVLDAKLRPLLPTIEQAEKLARATPAELQKALPADAAVVDFLKFVHVEQDKTKPGKAGEKQTPSYLAFVLTRDKVAWIDLGPARPIEDAIDAWRDAITSGKDIPLAVPRRVRELVWARVQKELPGDAKTVYVSPDLTLCRIPWAALPGNKPGTILLEDYSVATIPHGSFLLGKLWPGEGKPGAGMLVVGGVNYDGDRGNSEEVAIRGDLPVKPGAKLGWAALPAAAAEASGVSGAAAKHQLAVTPLRGEKATTAAVLAALPKARYAHFATHGFFADPTFRSVFQVDPRFFEVRNAQRVGAGAMSPLVMTGLVFAGANSPHTPGRGVLTGEALIDLDLSGLELAVLSACETGLGDVAGGEGTFGLQRAFHMAGAKNVVASLWKVPDQPTAALMALFYRNLWEKQMTPLAALREAQLEIYRNPDKIGALAEGFRGKFDVVSGADAGIKAGADGKTHPRLWAAFTLSGPGR